MREAKLEPDVITTQWQRALALLSEMREAKLEPDVISYSAGISACTKGEQWQRALALLSEMCKAKLEPDVISYSAGIRACAKGEQWQRALALLSEMREAKLEPDVISYSAGISAVREGRAVAAGAGAAERDAGGEAGARRHQLQRWDQRVREGRAVAAEGRAVAAGLGAAERWQLALALLSEMWEAKLEHVISSSAQRCDRRPVAERRCDMPVSYSAGEQRVSERWAVAAGSGAVQRDVRGGVGIWT
ncbi:unnamed protein product [Prorocentrum cordatum]|uniref:Pentatricopeptide repeat-containing protein, chloroplastic n=1 Tax=Prorocentrum cordatum TaxID=2364126 RepID=A0ABN9UZV9_9DINO|nr:unnamed protein product [Polarella glacialis]